jgi:hypothetical protein
MCRILGRKLPGPEMCRILGRKLPGPEMNILESGTRLGVEGSPGADRLVTDSAECSNRTGVSSLSLSSLATIDGVLKVGKAGKAAGKGKRVESGVQEKRRGFVTVDVVFGWGVEGGEGWQSSREGEEGGVRCSREKAGVCYCGCGVWMGC